MWVEKLRRNELATYVTGWAIDAVPNATYALLSFTIECGMAYQLGSAGHDAPPETRRYIEHPGSPFPQLFESRIFPGGELACHVVTIPRRYRRTDSPSDVAAQLGLHRFGDIARADIPAVFAAYLRAVAHRDEFLFGVQLDMVEPALSAIADEWLDLATNLLQNAYIPAERSPLSKEKLQELLIEAIAAVTAWAGFAVPSKSSSPVLLIILPAVVVIFRAVRGASKGLERGLEERVYRWVAPEPIESEPRAVTTARRKRLQAAKTPSKSVKSRKATRKK